MIKIVNLNKYYNRRKKNQIHVINNTNIELPDKGLVALLGPSGCGKTTLLNVIGGLDNVSNGHVYIDGKNITSKCSHKKDKIRNLSIGYIFQDYKLIDTMSVYDNVSLVLKMIGIKDKNEIKTRVDYILERVGMYRYRYRPCGMLSGGQRQRVGIARALVKNPDIILADEPTGNLDSKNTIEIMNIIKSISNDKLVILVTHEVELAKFYATRILEIYDGKIEKDYINKNNDKIDYKLDNTLYLKDFKYNNKNNDNNINIDYYSDEVNKLNLIIICKNGNIYIKNKDNEKLEVIDSNSNIEIVNDHYKKLDKKIYEKYSFDFNNIINNNIDLKYSSVFNIFNLISYGFKKVFKYNFLKKILLLGFFLSAIFMTYSISNIFGLLSVDDDEFIKTNKNYLKLDNNKISVEDFKKYEEIGNIEYIIPGDSQVKLLVDDKKYYQTLDSNLSIIGSITSLDMISENDVVLGEMANGKDEILIDKMVFDRALNIEMIGYYELSKMIDSLVRVKTGILEYKIVGVVDLGSPSIYVSESELINIISNSKYEGDSFGNEISDTVNNNLIYDYNLYKEKITITTGRAPDDDYEVIINDSQKDIYKLNQEIDNVKVNNNKLKVVGFYKSSDDTNNYYVNSNTIKYDLILNSKGAMIYSKDKDKTINDYKENSINLLDVYEMDREDYINRIKNSVNSGLVVSFVILGISLIEIILMIRSSFLSRVKEVGIYRAIGVKKSDIYKMFASEAIAITTLASVPGVLFMSYCLYVMSSISIIANNYVINISIVILCIIVMYLFNIFVGLIPVFNTIRKSPAEILSSYSID